MGTSEGYDSGEAIEQRLLSKFKLLLEQPHIHYKYPQKGVSSFLHPHRTEELRSVTIFDTNVGMLQPLHIHEIPVTPLSGESFETQPPLLLGLVIYHPSMNLAPE